MDNIVDKTYAELLQKLKKFNPEADQDLIERAFEFANHKHRGQLRQSGEPYIIHPINVGINLIELYLDEQAIAAGLLHDVLEDTDTTEKEIADEFGKDILYLVEGVSQLKKIKFQKKSQYIENLRKMFVSTAKDIRVILIRLCDRLHNMQTLEYLRADDQRRIATETLEIYAPIAQRLQIGSLRGELEDWAFKFLNPEEYRWLYNVTRKNFEDHNQLLTDAQKEIKKILKEEGVEVVDIQTRIKHIYSLYKKLQNYDNDLSQIYDIVAIRVIVPKIADCYAALGIIHHRFKPMKGRIKDYIARPKANGYTSLHTTVHLNNGDMVEIQIRTAKMHDQALYGIAAHWQYKTKGENQKKIQVSWVKELAKIMKEIKNTDQLETVKLDLFKNRIFVLTPQNDVIDLPEDSTPVDFAYHIHTELGNQVTQAKVNGKITPLSAKLQNGDFVEIISDKKKKGPDPEWLDFVQTSLARSKIKYFNRRKLSKWSKKLTDIK